MLGVVGISGFCLRDTFAVNQAVTPKAVPGSAKVDHRFAHCLPAVGIANCVAESVFVGRNYVDNYNSLITAYRIRFQPLDQDTPLRRALRRKEPLRETHRRKPFDYPTRWIGLENHTDFAGGIYGGRFAVINETAFNETLLRNAERLRAIHIHDCRLGGLSHLPREIGGVFGGHGGNLGGLGALLNTGGLPVDLYPCQSRKAGGSDGG